MNKRSVILGCLGWAVVALVLPAQGHALSNESCAVVSDKDVRGWFVAWNAALQAPTPERVVGLYAADATLLPTLENGPYTKGRGLEAYFNSFIKKGPMARIEEPTRTIELGCNVAYDIGLYDFTFRTDPPAKARYTFIYKWDAGQKRWLIAHHHSSLQPK